MVKRRTVHTLQAFLDANGWSQVQLAKRLGIQQSQLSKYIHGKQRPRPELAMRIAAITGVPLDSLLIPAPKRRVA